MKIAIAVLLCCIASVMEAQRTALAEIQSRSAPATFRAAFHFVAKADSSNFVEAGTITTNPLLQTDVLINYLLKEMNDRFRTAVLDAPSRDTRVRIEPVGGRADLRVSTYFYGPGERVAGLPGALNIIFMPYNRRGKSPTAATDGAGSNRIYVFNLLDQYTGGGNDWWSVGRSLIHEIGHTQGLDHTFKCDNPCDGVDLTVREECYGECATNNAGSVGSTNCYGSSKRELIMGYGSQVYLTACETEQWWKYLLAHRQPWVDYGLKTGPAPW